MPNWKVYWGYRVSEALAHALEASTADVLEKMFFIRGLGVVENEVPESGVTAHLTFEGDPPGWLTLRITAPAARSIAADFLGAEEAELSDREVGEVVSELANVICGSALSRVETKSTFRLATPRIFGPDEVPGGCGAVDRSAVVTHTVGISQGVAAVSIYTERAACPKTTEFVY